MGLTCDQVARLSVRTEVVSVIDGYPRWRMIVILFGLAVVAAAQVKPVTPGATIEGNDFVSTEMPKLRVTPDPKLTYIGSFPFDIDGIAGGYRFVWGEVDNRKHLLRTFIIQKEGFYLNSGGSYQYQAPNPVALGNHAYQHNVFIAGNEREIREHPGHEPDVTQKFLHGKGYDWDTQLVMSRFARVVDEAKKNEIIFFYTENLSAHTTKSADDLDSGDANQELKQKIKRAVDANSMRAFKVVD